MIKDKLLIRFRSIVKQSNISLNINKKHTSRVTHEAK